MDITFHIPAKPILMYGNAQDLDSLVTNLLTNAIKFSHPGGWVTCCLQAVGGRARLQVKDNGLGLTIVKSILEAHSGDISVESTHPRGDDLHCEPATDGQP